MALIYALPFLFGVAAQEIAAPPSPHAVGGAGLPAWAVLAAPWCGLFWPLASLVMLPGDPQRERQRAGPLLQAMLGLALPHAGAAWLLWGSFDIVPVYLAGVVFTCLALLVPEACRRITGLKPFRESRDGVAAPGRPLTLRSGAQFVAAWVFEQSRSGFAALSVVVSVWFAFRHGFAQVHEPLLYWLLAAMWFGDVPAQAWAAARETFPGAAPWRRAGLTVGLGLLGAGLAAGFVRLAHGEGLDLLLRGEMLLLAAGCVLLGLLRGWRRKEAG